MMRRDRSEVSQLLEEQGSARLSSGIALELSDVQCADVFICAPIRARSPYDRGQRCARKAVQLTAWVFELNIRHCDGFVQDISTLPHSL